MSDINWILCPVRNGLTLTQKALKSFLNQDIKTRVLLIDNSSEDGTREWARTMYPKVVTIYKHPPYSVAESWNKGLELLFNDTAVDNILVCNNDIELKPETYRLLLDSAAQFVTAVGNNDHNCLISPITSSFEYRPHPDFSCFLMRHKVWDAVGRFDEKFLGAFCEDWDYHVRLHKAGITACCLDIPFYHVGSATINTMSDSDREFMCRQADRNRAYFKEKWQMEGASPEYEAFFKEPYAR
jgi:GT2 family glycosyltransferase